MFPRRPPGAAVALSAFVQSALLRSSILLVVSLVSVASAQDLKIEFAKLLRQSTFKSESHSIWGGSLVKGDDGLYHLFYSRWPKHLGWARVTDSEVAHAVSDSPFGPFQFKDVALPRRGREFWDGWCTHNPTVHRFGDKYYLYYKSDFDGDPNLVRMQGLAIADDPLGPLKKHPLNPVINSGHETTLFPFRKGIAAFVIRDGLEHSTIQYAPDGVHFKIASIVSLMPNAGGPFIPDAFTDTQNGRGITWGLSHFTNVSTWDKNHAILARFDCDLSLDVNDPEMKRTGDYHKPDVFFEQGLSSKQKARIEDENQKLMKP